MAFAWLISGVGLAAAACFAWLTCPLGPRNGLSSFLFYVSSSSPAGLFAVAVLYVAATLWVALSIIVLGEMLDGLKNQQGAQVWQLVLCSVAAALCMPPLIIAIVMGATWIAVGVTILLGVCLARLLMIRDPGADRSEAFLCFNLLSGRDACFVAEIPFWRLGVPFLCALSAHLGVFAIITGHGLAAAGLLGGCSAVLTWYSPSRKTNQPASASETVPQTLRVLLLAGFVVVFTMAGMMRYMAMIRGSGAVSFSFLRMLLGGPSTSTASSHQSSAKKPGQKGDYAGVILLPVPEEAALIAPRELDPAETTHLPPADMQFTGVYWVLKPPDREPPRHSTVIRGSPAKIVLRSVDRTPLLMEARQPLRRPIDLNCCGAMQVVIGNADRDSDKVSIEVLLSDTERPGNAYQSLGYKFLSPDAAQLKGDAPTEQTLNFEMPRRSAMQQFDEIIVRFHLYGWRSTVSAKMAVERFRFTPKHAR